MNRKELGTYKRDALLGALGAFLMFVGDLCLSVIPASPTDSGLFDREVYLSGLWEPWRLPLLLATGLIGGLADWTNTLSPLLGREETAVLIHAQYNRLMPAMLIAYVGMLVLILTAAYAVLTKKTVLLRGMIANAVWAGRQMKKER